LATRRARIAYSMFPRQMIRKAVTFFRAHPRIDGLFVVLGLGIFLAITIANIANATLWFDEAFSWYITQFNFAEIAAFTATDVHPPFYYWVLKAWTLLFGNSDVALRSLSVIFGAAAIVLSYLLSRKLFGRLVGGVSLLFLVLSPIIIRYSDEARMYMLVSVIVLAATLLLIKIVDGGKRWQWIAYGVLVMLGMLTHYFTALIWIAHWIWRAVVIFQKTDSLKKFVQKFFSRQWILVHIIAIGLFAFWLPAMLTQVTTVQNNGFWIGPAGIDSFTNYFSNFFYYLEHDKVLSWLGLLLVITLVLVIVLAVRSYKSFDRREKQHYLLPAILTFAPIVLLFLGSLPPLRPLFVERYLIPTTFFFIIFLAVTLVAGTRRWRPAFRVLPVLLVAGMMVYGISNVFYYGNFNKNNNTHIFSGELVREIAAQAEDGQPIVASSPWIFYEAIPYATEEHPVYFIDENTQYIYGSLDMLKNRDEHKITDLAAFTRENPIIWYIGDTTQDTVPPYKEQWENMRTISIYDQIADQARYRGTEYRVSAE
jgi:mannosyltransferase